MVHLELEGEDYPSNAGVETSLGMLDVGWSSFRSSMSSSSFGSGRRTPKVGMQKGANPLARWTPSTVSRPPWKNPSPSARAFDARPSQKALRVTRRNSSTSTRTGRPRSRPRGTCASTAPDDGPRVGAEVSEGARGTMPGT